MALSTAWAAGDWVRSGLRVSGSCAMPMVSGAGDARMRRAAAGVTAGGTIRAAAQSSAIPACRRARGKRTFTIGSGIESRDQTPQVRPQGLGQFGAAQGQFHVRPDELKLVPRIVAVPLEDIGIDRLRGD